MNILLPGLIFLVTIHLILYVLAKVSAAAEERNEMETEGLEDVYWEILAKEGITPALVDYVMLDIAFTPVLAVRGEQLGDEVMAVPSAKKGWWIVRHPMITSAVDDHQLKVMRCRYLLRSKEQLGLRLPKSLEEKLLDLLGGNE